MDSRRMTELGFGLMIIVLAVVLLSVYIHSQHQDDKINAQAGQISQQNTENKALRKVLADQLLKLESVRKIALNDHNGNMQTIKELNSEIVKLRTLIVSLGGDTTTTVIVAPTPRASTRSTPAPQPTTQPPHASPQPTLIPEPTGVCLINRLVCIK